MKSLSAQALAQKALAGVNVVWMVDADLDEYGLATEHRRYGSRGYTIGAYTYEDLLSARGGLDIGESRVAPRGGLASVGSLTVVVRDEEDESGITDTYIIINDPVTITQVFVNGAEVLTDRFELVRGVVERHRVSKDTWILTVKDDSKTLIRQYPAATLDGAQYPFAYDPGQVIPEAFGNLNHGPDDGDGLSAVLAPIRMTDKYAVRGTSGRRKKTQGDVYQWYPDAGRLAKVVKHTANADELKTVDMPNPPRVLVTRPIRAAGSNDVTDWQDVATGDITTAVEITTGDNLDLYLSGSPKLGAMSAIEIQIVATGDYTVSVYDFGVLKEGPDALNGNQTIPLTLAEWDSWELALMNVCIDGPGAAATTDINDIKLVIDFDDFASSGDRAPDFWQDAVGYEDLAANYRDGGAIGGLEIVTGDDADFDTVGNWVAVSLATIAGGYDSGDAGHATTLRVEAGSAANDGAEIVGEFALTAGNEYRIAFDYKHIDTTALNDPYRMVRFVQTGIDVQDLPDIALSLGAWVSYSTTFTATFPHTELELYANNGSGHVNNEVLFDNLSLQEIGSALRNPVHQLEAIQRDTNFINLLDAQIVSGWDDAAASRASWYFDWFLRTVQGERFLNDFCFQAGLHLFPEEGGFSVAAMDKTRDPQHFFSGDWHMPAINGTDPDPSKWEDGFEVRAVDASEVINEFHLRYRLHGPSGEYKASTTASGQYRITGTCSLTGSGVLTDGSATFQADNVVDGERLYIAGDVDYEVDGAPISETQLNVTVVGGGTPSTLTAETYYLGPNVDGVMVLSQLSFKRVEALGTRQLTFLDDGGFKSPFIVDDDTAEALKEHVKEWFAYPREFVTFPVNHTAVDVQLGDVLMLDHDKLRASKKPVAMTTLDGDYNSAATVLTVQAGYGSLFRDDDWLLIINPTTFQTEMVKVVSIDVGLSELTVTRGELGTPAMALSDTWIIYRITVKWMVIGLTPMTPSDPLIRIRAVQIPPSYLPTGRVSQIGWPAWSAATPDQRMQSGWSTLRNGRVVDLDKDSNVSYVGPDAGIYVIV